MKKIIVLILIAGFFYNPVSAQFKKELDRSKSEESKNLSGSINLNSEPSESRSPELKMNFTSIPYNITAGDIKPVAFDNEGRPIAFEGKLPEGKRSNKDKN